MPVYERFLSTLRQNSRVVAMFVMILVGFFIPQAAIFSPLIQYFVFTMMFLSFVGLHFERSALQPSLLTILAVNIAVALVTFFVLARVDTTLALAGFMAAISPTAISSPVVIGLIERRVDCIVMAVLVTNIGIALLIPFLLPWLAGSQVEVSMWEVLWSVIKIAIVPLILARMVARLPHAAQQPFIQAKKLTFALWMGSLFLIVAKASHFIHSNTAVPIRFLIKIAVIAMTVCVINFSLGALIGKPEFRRETSQALGQKNLSFTIWLALTFINPIVALGPTFYILFHNSYNSYQIYRFTHQNKSIKP
jgi:BASS family bile acid:Na+ symporter